MTDNCVNHTFEYAEGYCRTCGYPYCGPCLIFAFGPKKPAYCVQCAISAAGVRSNAAHQPIRTKAEARKLHKEKVRSDKLAAKAAAKDPAKDLGRMAGTALNHGEANPVPGPPVPADGGSGGKSLLGRFRSS